MEKLQRLGITLEQANAIVRNAANQALRDHDHGGNINVLQEVGGRVIRITLDPKGKRIISAGLMRGYSVTHGIARGRFTKIW